MSTAPTLAIASSSSPLPKCSPHLMPFHIAYSGPAPMSTYFMPKIAPPPDYGLLQTTTTKTTTTTTVVQTTVTTEATERDLTNESQQTVIEEDVSMIAGSSTTVVEPSTSSLATLADQTPAIIEGEGETPKEEKDGVEKHFVAAFRGRTMRGLLVDVPKGYSGIVLRTPDETNPHTKPQSRASRVASSSRAKPPPSRRDTRSRRPQTNDDEEEATHMDVDNSDGEDLVDGDGIPADEETLRVLKPVSTFSSFTIWNPDIPIDEGKDEYLRSLTEWMKLSEEINYFEDD